MRPRHVGRTQERGTGEHGPYLLEAHEPDTPGPDEQPFLTRTHRIGQTRAKPPPPGEDSVPGVRRTRLRLTGAMADPRQSRSAPTEPAAPPLPFTPPGPPRIQGKKGPMADSRPCFTSRCKEVPDLRHLRGVENMQTATDRDRASRFTTLYTRDHPRVSAFVHRRVGDRATAEELTAEVFRIAWERALGGEDVGAGWLFVTARHLVSNHHRAAARLTELHRRITEERGGPPTSGEESVVLDVLELLPERHRDVLLLRYWDGLSAAEAAEVLGCSASAVWVRLHRARKAFRDAYASHASSTSEGSFEESA